MLRYVIKERLLGVANSRLSKRKRSRDSEKASRKTSRRQDLGNLAKSLRDMYFWTERATVYSLVKDFFHDKAGVVDSVP